LRAFPYLLCAAFLACGCATASAQDYVAAHQVAAARGGPLPIPHEVEPGLDTDRAYEIQKAIVARRLQTDAIGGFKGGLPTRAAQIAAGANEPMMGVLFESGRRSTAVAIRLHSGVTTMAEVELGFINHLRIDKPAPDVETLKSYFRTATPVVELPKVVFADVAKATTVDHIATNVGSDLYIVGTPVRLRAGAPSALQAQLEQGGVTVAEGRPAELNKDHWAALLWLVNKAVSEYGPVEPGRIFITGSFTKAAPVAPGDYVASLSGFAPVRFSGEQ